MEKLEKIGEVAKNNVVKAKSCNIGAMAGVMMTLANVYKVNRTMKGKDRLKVSHMFYGPYETSSKLDGFSHLRSEWTMQRRGSWP